MNETMPNPALEGYRTAHEQNEDGSYKYTVVPGDLVKKKPVLSETSRRIDRGATKLKGELDEDNAPDIYDVVMTSKGEKRQITKRMEQAYRLHHHDFEAKTLEETARIMGISVNTVEDHLWEMRKIAPQLFPILTKMQAKVWHLFFNEGMSHKMIADTLDISISASKCLLGRAKAKYDFHKVLQQRMVVMDPKQLASFRLNNEIVKVF